MLKFYLIGETMSKNLFLKIVLFSLSAIFSLENKILGLKKDLNNRAPKDSSITTVSDYNQVSEEMNNALDGLLNFIYKLRILPHDISKALKKSKDLRITYVKFPPHRVYPTVVWCYLPVVENVLLEFCIYLRGVCLRVETNLIFTEIPASTTGAILPLSSLGLKPFYNIYLSGNLYSELLNNFALIGHSHGQLESPNVENESVFLLKTKKSMLQWNIEIY